MQLSVHPDLFVPAYNLLREWSRPWALIVRYDWTDPDRWEWRGYMNDLELGRAIHDLMRPWSPPMGATGQVM